MHQLTILQHSSVNCRLKLSLSVSFQTAIVQFDVHRWTDLEHKRFDEANRLI